MVSRLYPPIRAGLNNPVEWMQIYEERNIGAFNGFLPLQNTGIRTFIYTHNFPRAVKPGYFMRFEWEVWKDHLFSWWEGFVRIHYDNEPNELRFPYTLNTGTYVRLKSWTFPLLFHYFIWGRGDNYARFTFSFSWADNSPEYPNESDHPFHVTLGRVSLYKPVQWARWQE